MTHATTGTKGIGSYSVYDTRAVWTVSRQELPGSSIQVWSVAMAFFNGTNASETIYGTDSRDIIFGNGGSDEIFGFGGDDDLYGGLGNDDIYGGAGADNISGGQGINNFWGGSGYDWFIMSARGNSFSDDWIGDFQFDIDQVDVSDWGVSSFEQLQALFRTDGNGDAYLNAFYNGYDHYLTISDVSADDLISSDFIYSNSGAISGNGTEFRDVMFGSDYGDVLNGLSGGDILLGGVGADVLRGGRGADRLIGGTGNDVLEGGLGSDRLTGDSGADRFDFNSVIQSTPALRDFILDFQKGFDIFDVSGVDAIAALANNQAFDWIGSAGFTAAGQLHYTTAGGNTIISGSTDADAEAEFQFVIRGLFTMTESDFIL
jgi:Ca2+-binding RTX toxin-like protein